MGDEAAGYPCWVDLLLLELPGEGANFGRWGSGGFGVPCVTKEVRRNAGGIEMQGDLVREAVLPAVQCSGVA
jgi:hypothetical protein